MANRRMGFKPSAFLVWLIVLLALAAVGGAAILYGFWQGHENVYNASRWMPWGILISTYVFFAVSASGMCLISSLGHVFHIERYEPLGRRAVFFAMISLVAGFWALAGDLERPWRLPIWAVLTPGFSSAIWWMGVLYALYLVVLIIEFFYLSRAEMVRRSAVPANPSAASLDAAQQRLKRYKSFAWYAGIGGFALAIFAPGTLGAVFGVVRAADLWHGPLMPVYFVVSALVSGAALLTLAIVLTYRLGRKEMGTVKGLVQSLGKLLLAFLAVFLLFTAWRILSGLYGSAPGGVDAAEFLLGRLGGNFWVFEIFVGILVPMVILLIPKTRTMLGIGLASFMVMVGMFLARYDFVVAGQLTSVGREGEAVGLGLMPSLTEMLVVLGSFALFAALYLIGNRFLPLSEHTEAESHR